MLFLVLEVVEQKLLCPDVNIPSGQQQPEGFMETGREEEHRSGTQSRIPRVHTTALVLGTVLVVATTVIHIQSPSSRSGDHARHRHRFTFIWISASTLLVDWTVLWIVHSSSRVRAWIVKWNQLNQAPVGAIAYALLSALALSLGIYGLWTCSEQGRVSNPELLLDVRQPDRESLGPLAITTVTAAAWLLVAVALVAMSVVAALRAIRPGRETPPALMLLRCACCSRTVQRVVLALPFVSLCIASAVLWHQASSHSHACAIASEPSRLLLGSTIVFGSIVTALGIATIIPILLRQSLSSTTHARRRVARAVVFCLLIVFGAVAITWAVKSWQWLGQYDHHTLPIDESCTINKHDIRAVRFTTGALFTAGGLLLAMTSCCRLERHFLATAATPHIDMSMLSPHAIRPPALTKSPDTV